MGVRGRKKGVITRTPELNREYSRKYYYEHKKELSKYHKDYYLSISDGKKRHKRTKVKMNSKEERVYQDEITELWRTYGVFMEPDKKIINKRIEKEELLNSDDIDYIDLNDLVQDDDESGEESIS